MLRAFSKTDIGKKRQINQDAVYVSETPIGTLPNLFLVADGMGGHNAGDFAARITVDTVVEFIADAKEEEPEFMLEKAIMQANAKVRMSAANNPELEGMGTTVVVATCKDGKLCVGNVGDSRLYIMSEGALVQLTIDHSWVEEMVRRGAMTREEAKNHPDKNIITRAVGTEDDIKIDFFRAELKKGDLVLMCTDGLTNMVQDEEILERLTKVREGKATLEEMVSEFIDFANLRGGMDNISVVLIAEE